MILNCMGLHSFYDFIDMSFFIIITCMPSDMNYQTLGLYNYVSSVLYILLGYQHLCQLSEIEYDKLYYLCVIYGNISIHI